MKNCILIILFILASKFNSFSQITPLEKFQDVIKSEQNAANSKITVFHSAPTDNYNLTYQRCEWSISPDTLFIAGVITSNFILNSNSDNIYFDASDSLFIDSVYFENDPATFEHVNHELKINFPLVLDSGTTHFVKVYYHGIPSSTGFGSFAITPHETANTIWTLSEPYGSSDWWPCKQTLDDKMDSVDVFVTTPSQYKSGGPGLLVSEITNDGFTTYHWKSNYPIVTYLIGIAVSNYEVYQFYAPHNGDSVLFYNLLYPETFDDAVTGINAIVPSFELFSDIFGNYSFAKEKYGHMQFGWGGGMEHQTMSSVTSFNYDLLVHEMAHQWFGDKITCASWRDIWLNEGFATYSTWLSYDFTNDPNHYFEGWLTGARDFIVSIPDGSVWVDDTTSTSRIFDGRLSYYKGAWLLHMLRWELGEDIFFDAIKNYITDPALEYNFATTEDLIIHLESEGDTLLIEFFNDWFYGEGFPSYHLIWTRDENNFVTIALDQTSSDTSTGFFEMKVPVRLIGDNDSVDVILNHKKNGQLFQFPTSFVVNEIRLDPDIKLLHAKDEIIHTDFIEGVLQMILYPNPVDDILHLQMLSPIAADYEILLFNNLAQKVFNNIIRLDGSMGLISIDISELAPGQYVLLVQDGENEIVQKLIIQ